MRDREIPNTTTRTGRNGNGPDDVLPVLRPSDESIEFGVRRALEMDERVDVSDVAVRVEGGEATLLGEVDDRVARGLVQTIAEECAGVREVHSELKLRSEVDGRLRGMDDRSETDRDVTPAAVYDGTHRDDTLRGALRESPGAWPGRDSSAPFTSSESRAEADFE